MSLGQALALRKPRIKRNFGRWWACGRRQLKDGATPVDAYWNWRQAVIDDHFAFREERHQ